MNRETRLWFEIGALQLAAVVVATHLYVGLPRLVRQPAYGTFTDPRPALFVLSATAIIAGAIYVVLGGRRVPTYALGILLLTGYVVGYVWWHLTGHVGGLPWVEAQPTRYHDVGAVETIVYHLRSDPVELVSKAAETALAIVLAVLLVDARRSSDAEPSGSGPSAAPDNPDARVAGSADAAGSDAPAADAPDASQDGASDADGGHD